MSNFIGIMIDKIMPEQVPDLVHFLQTKIRWIYFCQLFMEKKNEKTMLSASNIKATQKKKTTNHFQESWVYTFNL